MLTVTYWMHRRHAGQLLSSWPIPIGSLATGPTSEARPRELHAAANLLQEILDGRVRVARGWAGLTATDAPKNVVRDVKQQWIRHVEGIADHLYPTWREHFARAGKRLPAAVRKELNYRADFEAHSEEFAGGLLDWLGAKSEPNLMSDMSVRLDAVLRLTAFVVSQFLEGNYSLEKNDSDVFDQFQLHYLALDRFIIVTNDADLWTRTAGSPQAPRIMSFENFLRSLS